MGAQRSIIPSQQGCWGFGFPYKHGQTDIHCRDCFLDFCRYVRSGCSHVVGVRYGAIFHSVPGTASQGLAVRQSLIRLEHGSRRAFVWNRTGRHLSCARSYLLVSSASLSALIKGPGRSAQWYIVINGGYGCYYIGIVDLECDWDWEAGYNWLFTQNGLRLYLFWLHCFFRGQANIPSV